MTPFLRVVVILGLLSAAAACASTSSPVAVPGAGEAAITRGAVAALEARWDGVELGSSRSATCPGVSGAPVPLVRGDFNGDGAEDVVLWVTTSGTPRLAALFARLDGEYTVAEVGEAAAVGSSALDVARRGTTYQLTSLTVDSFFGVDTVVLRACDGTRTAWFWTGQTFQAQSIAN